MATPKKVNLGKQRELQMNVQFLIVLRFAISVAQLFFFALLSESVSAIAPTEAEINTVKVGYSNGDSIEIRCAIDDCSVQVMLRGKKFYFDHSKIKGNALPIQAVLYPRAMLANQFSFDINLDCETSGYPPSTMGVCMANYLITGGEIEKISKYAISNGKTIPISSTINPIR